MMDVEKLKQEIELLVKPLITERGLQLHAINSVNDFGGPGIEILVTNRVAPDQPLDFETLTQLNEALSVVLDAKLQLSERYYLIVGSAGLEREITSETELIQALEKYLALDLREEIKGLNHFKGHLKAYNPRTELFSLEFFKKGQKQKVQFKWSQVARVRHAIKL